MICDSDATQVDKCRNRQQSHLSGGEGSWVLPDTERRQNHADLEGEAEGSDCKKDSNHKSKNKSNERKRARKHNCMFTFLRIEVRNDGSMEHGKKRRAEKHSGNKI